MYNATHFTYDGVSSATYGLQIVDFNDNAVQEADVLSYTLTLQKTPGSLRFSHGGVDCDTPPICEFSVLSESELSVSQRRTFLSWIMGRNAFKDVKFLGGDTEEYTYRGVFISAKTIWVRGRCHGFRLTLQFDSPYARGASVVKTVNSGTHLITLDNPSDITDAYTYPKVVFTGGSVDIVNITDDSQRHFTFSGLTAAETITVDNEVKYISSTIGGEKLSKFTSKNWLRLRKGDNQLQIIASGTVTITCPHYALIGY